MLNSKYSYSARRRKQFQARLTLLSKNCDFHDTEREIKSQVIQKCHLRKIREKSLNEPNITLSEPIKYGRTLDATTVQGQAMVGPSVGNANGRS